MPLLAVNKVLSQGWLMMSYSPFARLILFFGFIFVIICGDDLQLGKGTHLGRLRCTRRPSRLPQGAAAARHPHFLFSFVLFINWLAIIFLETHNNGVWYDSGQLRSSLLHRSL